MSITILGHHAAAAPTPPVVPPVVTDDCVTPTLLLDVAITVTFTEDCE